MRYLLDTHTFIWWAGAPDNLSAPVMALLQNPEHSFFLSLVSIWEMQIKAQLGKLALALPLAELVSTQVRRNAIELLPIRLEHILRLGALEPHHKDPFDRLLIVQAQTEGVTLLSRDPVFGSYDVDVLW